MSAKTTDFLDDWKFSDDDVIGAHLPLFDDSKWQTVSIPHDFCIEKPMDKTNGVGCTAFYSSKFGFYRKSFMTTPLMLHNTVEVYFDGVYNNANFYINGEYLGFHPNGYTPVRFDLTKYLKPVGEKNLLAVRVDHTRYADSRFYTGAGILREVKLNITPLLRISPDGVKIETHLNKNKSARIKIKLELDNKLSTDENLSLTAEIKNRQNVSAAVITKEFSIAKNSLKKTEISINLDSCVAWSIENPYLYTLSLDLKENNRSTQSLYIKFGIRNIKFDPDKGFFLNGVHTLIKGVCLHSDMGLLGCAFNKAVMKNRLETLKECGCNAIRTAHNPAASSFLDLCDEMGFLVQEEFFDEWDNPKDKRANGDEKKVDYITRSYTSYFSEWAERDISSVINRDKNHPSIIQWSIGNEIEWTYPKYNLATGYFNADATGNYFWTLPPNSQKEIRENIKKLPEDNFEIYKTAKRLSGYVKENDLTRPVIANCILPCASYESGYTDALDIVGYSYRRIIYDYGHENYPNKPIMGTENLAQWHDWKAVIDRKFVAGMFIWTGFDYLGETGPEHDKPWPLKCNNSGMVDLAGYKKPSFYMMKSLWSDTPTVKLYTQTLDKSLYKIKNNEPVEKEKDGWQHRLWEWQPVNNYYCYKNKEKIVAEVYSNYPQAELFLNGKSLGVKNLLDNPDHIFKWCFEYQKGELEVKAFKGKNVISDRLTTEGEPSKISVSPKVLSCGNKKYLLCSCELLDSRDNHVSLNDKRLNFSFSDNLKLIGTDNGAFDYTEIYGKPDCPTYLGRCIALFEVVSKNKTFVSVSAQKLQNTLEINL